MTNLGSDDTPVKGENFSLPAGAQIDEDGGELVVRDSAGEIILRRDETAGNWNFEGGELRNIGSVHTDVLSVGDGLVAGEIIDSDSGSDSIQFTGVAATDFEQLIIRLDSFRLNPPSGDAQLELTIDNNDADGQYGYIFNDGVINANENTLQLADLSGRVDFAGSIVLDVVKTGSGTDGFSIAETVTLPFRNLGDLNTFTLVGGTPISPTDSQSIELFAVNGSSNTLSATLYGVRK